MPGSDADVKRCVDEAKSLADDIGPANPKLFTWVELSKLNSQSNAHVAYEGKVYDVSSFVSKHPGGTEQIMSGASHDITQIFKSYHKEDTFARVLSKYYVGDLVDKELPVYQKESTFFSILKAKVQEHMKQNALDPKNDYWTFLQYFVLLVLYIGSMYVMLNYYRNVAVCILSAVVWGHIISHIGHTLFHDSIHYGVTHKPIVWKALKIIATSITGFSSYTWFYRHIFGHHIFTNVEEFDPDIDTGSKNKIGHWRIRPSQSLASRFLYQHLYMPILYFIMFTKLKTQDFDMVFTLKKDNIRLNPLTKYLWVEFYGTKLIHVTLRYVIPLYFIPIRYLLIILPISEMVCSFTFAQFVVINHINEKAVMVKANEKKEIPADWAEQQVSSTLDFATDSWFWTAYSGGLNHQTAHHLFPGIIRAHYRWITPIIKETCAEQGIEYNCVNSFVDMLSHHYGYLKKMGSGKDDEIIRNKKRS